MNAFRIIADWSHVFAIVILLAKMICTKSCLGISGRSQILFSIVYVTRYIDIFFSDMISIYITFMKLFFVHAAFIAIFLIFVLFKKTYQHEKDDYLTEFLLLPCFVLGLVFSYEVTVTEVLWAFSIYLEAVAILPQFHMIYKSKQIERTIMYYLIALGFYRTMYIVNWVYRYFSEGHADPIAWSAGIVYTLVYLVGAVIFTCNGTKITSEGQRTYLRQNIFFISNNEPLITSNLTNDPTLVQKPEVPVDHTYNIEKV